MRKNQTPAYNAQQSFSLARQHQKAGRLDDAELIYRQLLAIDPKNADVLHMLGLVAKQKGQIDRAVELIREALKRKPNYPEALYNLGNALQVQKRADEAIIAYQKSIDLRPNFVKAYANLGIALVETRKFAEAIKTLRQAIAIDPGFAEVYFHMGNALRETGPVEDAIAAFRQAIQLKPDYAEAHHNLGFCLGLKGETESAAAAFAKAIAHNIQNRDTYDNLSVALRFSQRLDQAVAVAQAAIKLYPDAASCYCNLGHALNESRKFEPAAVAYQKAISLDADLIVAYQGLSQVMEKQGKIAEAIGALQAGQQRKGANDVFRFELAALGVGESPSSPPPEYMIGLFNEYANNFDEHLVKVLHYTGPQLLFDAVAAAKPQLPMDILDLGCGTGLCGQLFKPVARHLTGIDLASKMIEMARHRGVYDELEEQDVSVALEKRPGGCDLILAADVFIYVGRLEKVFGAAATSLRPGGLLAFTVESIDDGEFVLRKSRRYAHSAQYIRRLAAEFGFTEVSIVDAVLRTESELPMPGKVVVLRVA